MGSPCNDSHYISRGLFLLAMGSSPSRLGGPYASGSGIPVVLLAVSLDGDLCVHSLHLLALVVHRSYMEAFYFLLPRIEFHRS